MSITLPSIELFQSFLDFTEEMRSNCETLWDPYLPKKEESSQEFILRLRKREIDPEIPLVPETTFWAVQENAQESVVVGRISLRHRLNENLSKMGGHVGYEVRPSYRRQGIATQMLKLILETPKAKEIGKLLLTCSPTNIGSNKTILTNGGVFHQKVFVDSIKEDRNHYWITIS